MIIWGYSHRSNAALQNDFVKVFINITVNTLEKASSVLQTYGTSHCQTQSLTSKRASPLFCCVEKTALSTRSKESGVVLPSIVSCQNSCSRCFLQIFHAKILMCCRLEATHEAIEGSLRMDPGALPFFGWTTFLPQINYL